MFSSTTHKEDELFIPLNLESFRFGGKKSVDSGAISSFIDDAPRKETEIPGFMEPYSSALIGASGISRVQAKTCFYYAVVTHLLPDDLQSEEEVKSEDFS